MFFLLLIITLIIVYIVSFKENFTKENIEKAVPVIAVFSLFIFVICVISSILRR